MFKIKSPDQYTQQIAAAYAAMDHALEPTHRVISNILELAGDQKFRELVLLQNNQLTMSLGAARVHHPSDNLIQPAFLTGARISQYVDQLTGDRSGTVCAASEFVVRQSRQGR